MTDNVKYLDLDVIVPTVKKRVNLTGKRHDFQEPSVELMLSEFQYQLDLAEGKFGSLPAGDILAHTVDFIHQCFPTIERDLLFTLTPNQLGALRRFIDEQVEAPAEVKEDQGNA